MNLIPKNFEPEINLRISKIQKELNSEDIEALLIGSNVNIYYSSGRFFRGYVLITGRGETFWFVIKPNIIEAETNKVFLIRKPEDIPGILKKLGFEAFSSIGLEENDLSYSDIIRLQKLFPEAILKNASLALKRARMVKTEWELGEMAVDGKHHVNVYRQVKDCYKPGMTDLEFQIEIERRLRLEGSLGVSRVSGNLMEINLGSVITGENADNPSPYEFTMGGKGMHPVLPVGASNESIEEHHPVMIDMNGAFNGYQTDMTRVWCLGEVSELAQKAHDCSIEILRCLEKLSVPGTPVSSLYQTAMEIVENHNLKEYFMGHNSQVGFIGHGVGIELNELPVLNAKSKDILLENMTIAIEPKFVIPHVGAVGVENTYVVKKEGLENLTVFPEEIQKL